MYWTFVFALVALLSAPFAATAAGTTAAAALWVGVVFSGLALGSAVGALLTRLR